LIGDRERRTAAILNGIQIAIWMYLVFLAARLAYAWLFSTYEGYDDEGYLATSLVCYFKGMPLYSSTFTQYGPFYYILSTLIYGLPHAPVTTDNIRFITLGHWLTASIFCGLAVRRLTRSFFWAILAFYLVFFHVWGLRLGPGHPQELIISLTSAAIFTASFYRQNKFRIISSILAALLACIMLTKINIGAYLCAAFLLAITLRSPSRSIRMIGIVGAGLSIAAPVVITQVHLKSWAGPLATVVALSLAAECLVLWLGKSGRYGLARPLNAAPAAITFAVISLVVIGIVLFQGTTFQSLLGGTITRPARMPALWYLELRLNSWTVPAAILGLLTAIAYLIYSGRAKNEETVRAIGTLGKLIWGAVCVFLAYEHQIHFRGEGFREFTISFASPFAWLLLAPDLRRDSNPFPRTLLAIAAVFEVLLIYPVAGSQRDFSTLLFVPAAVVSLADGLAGLRVLIARAIARCELSIRQTQRAMELHVAFLRHPRPRNSPALSATARPWIACLLVIIFAVTGYPRISSGNGVRHAYKRLLVPTYLSGADRLRISFDDAGLYHWVVSNIEAHCGSLVTEPYYGSFHLWTGLPLLTGMNVTSWMQLLTPEEQQQIVDKLKIQAHPCVIYDPGSVTWWLRFKTQNPPPPLVRYIAEHFRTQLREHAFQLQLPLNVAGPIDEFLLFRSTHFDSRPGYTIRSDIPVNGDGKTFSMWFRSRASGALFGCQTLDNLTEKPAASMPVLHIAADGHLSAGASRVSTVAVNDGLWHQVVLVRNGGNPLLYLDGSLLIRPPGKLPDPSLRFCEIGDAFSSDWMRFKGDIARAKLVGRPLSTAEVLADYRRELPVVSK
jgi:Concanavalin A-like lectin/glucanases superfamily